MYWIIYFLLLFTTLLDAKSDRRLFMQAYRAAQQGDSQKAEKIYMSICNKSPAVWYNLGNIAFTQQQNAQARLYWMRASKKAGASLFKDAVYNLRVLDEQQDQQGPSFTDHLWYWLTLFNKYTSILFLQLVLLCVWCMLIRFVAHTKNWLFFVGAGLLLALLAIGPCAVAYHAQRQQAVVLEKEIAVYNGPNRSFYSVGSIERLAVLAVLKQENQWYKVAGDDVVGWVPADKIELV